MAAYDTSKIRNVVLVGHSGCGKTTILRMIAGFDLPDGGEILLDGRNIADTPPEKRPLHTVFQSYALFPHLSVADNVAFPLRMSKVPAAEAKRRIVEEPGKYWEDRVYGEFEGGGTQVLYLSHVPFDKLGLPKLGKEGIPRTAYSIQEGLYKGFIAPVAAYAVLAGVMLRNRRANKSAAGSNDPGAKGGNQ